MDNYNLFLDDERNPLDTYQYTNNDIYKYDKWFIVRNYADFVAYILKYGLPEMVSFDHDLADQHYTQCNQGSIDYNSLTEKTGYDCAKWLVEYCVNQGFISLPRWYTHTMNPVGGKNIQDLFINYTKHRNE